MLKSYLISALRYMKRAYLYSAISIFCLAVGITGAILVTMYLNHELSYDAHHKDHDRIYRMEGMYHMSGADYHLAITPFPLAMAMQEEFGQVETYARFFLQDDVMVRTESGDFLEQGIVYADSTVFDVFTHHFVYGQAKGSLAEPNTVVLNRSLSEKYFGRTDPVGENLEIAGNNYMVTGVTEDLPENTHFRYSAMLSMPSADSELVYSMDPELFWNINTNYTYIKLHPNQRIEDIMAQMDAFSKKYVDPMGETFGASAEYQATPLRETHFLNLMMAPETGNRSVLLIFSLVALFLVVIAAINYTNLATARAAKRAREIGIRKVNGANKGQLMTQFMSESLLTAFISLALSLFLVELLLPFFNTMTGSSFSLSQLLEGRLLIQVLGITLLTGVAAGFYPAFVLSRMNPSLIVKGIIHQHNSQALLRKSLVVFQFAISVLLVTATITVQNQLRFLQDKPLGFNKENRAVVTLRGSSRQGIETLENTFRQNPSITGTTKAFSIPGREYNVNAVRIEGESGMEEAVIAVNYIDYNFFEMLQIPLLSGRAFEQEMRSDAAQAVIINQSAARAFGWHENPIGKQIHMQFDQEGQPGRILRVVGVTEDFHFLTLENPIEPHMLMLPETPATYRHIIVQYDSGQEEAVLDFLDSSTRSFDTANLPNIAALGHSFSHQFDEEQKQGRIFGTFAVVTIIISFLGLFGLSSFMTEQRRKEIGIRKVLGSSYFSVLALLYREFSLLILVAVVIAAPVSWFLMDKWLEAFVYRIDMSAIPIILSAAIAFAVAISTVSYHSLRAASMNPVDSIRSE